MNFNEYFGFDLPEKGLFAYMTIIRDADNNIIGLTFQNSKDGRGNNKDQAESCIGDAELKIQFVTDYNNIDKNNKHTVEVIHWRLKKEFIKWLENEDNKELTDLIKSEDGEPTLRTYKLGGPFAKTLKKDYESKGINTQGIFTLLKSRPTKSNRYNRQRKI
jgi:hypothetical protein